MLPKWLASMYHENDDPEDLEIDLLLSVCSDQEEDGLVQGKMNSLTELIGHVLEWCLSCEFAIEWVIQVALLGMSNEHCGNEYNI